MKHLLTLFFLIFLATGWALFVTQAESIPFYTYHINPKEGNLRFYWKNKDGRNYGSFGALKNTLNKEQKGLRFAMNGGMYNSDGSPVGLYVENGVVLHELDTIQKGYGNFYLQPNGIFAISNKGIATIVPTDRFVMEKSVYNATQSGPMLLINGEIHSAFNRDSKNLNIRNGVGILPNGEVLFVLSKEKINFYNFAHFFLTKGCKNALYLDGFVSKMYMPSLKRMDLGGDFGVIISEIE